MKKKKIEISNRFRSLILKTISFVSFFLILVFSARGQLLCYDNFEGTKFLYYSEKFGILDTLAKNPAPNSIDSSKKCALYIRNGSKKFDNIKMSLPGRLIHVDSFATYLGVPPQITMKVYTSAPVGTLVEILLGSKGRNTEYPAGTNSQYQAYTTVTNAWEELKFKFSQVPQGSETSFDEIDQVTLLFFPNSSNSDTYYFDEIKGPPLASNRLKPENSKVSPPKKGKEK